MALKTIKEEHIPDKPSNFFVSIPGTILIGSVLISLSILISGGVIKPKGSVTTAGTSANGTSEDSETAQTAADPAKLKSRLVDLAGSINIDKGKFTSCLDTEKYKDEINKDAKDAEAAGVTGTPGFVIGKPLADGKVDGVLITGAYPFSTFKAVIDKFLVGTSADQIKEEGVEVGGAFIDDDPILGDANAPLVMIEFSDYECPFCKRHFSQTLPDLDKEYIKTGKLKLVFRDFIAVSGHNPAATTEALAVNCVKELGGDQAYYKYHDLIFSKTTSNGLGVQD